MSADDRIAFIVIMTCICPIGLPVWIIAAFPEVVAGALVVLTVIALLILFLRGK